MRALVAVLALALLAASCADDTVTGSDQGEAPSATAPNGTAAGTTASDGSQAGNGILVVEVGVATLQPGGNRVAAGMGAVTTADPIDVHLPATPLRVLPVTSVRTGSLPGDGAGHWFVDLDDGDDVVVGPDGVIVGPARAAPGPSIEGFTDPLPDAVVVDDGTWSAALVGPTDRYPHGALGDRIEAESVQVVGPGLPPSGAVFGPEAPAVIEGIAPILVDVDGDGTPEVVVTESDAEVGARLALWSIEGRRLAVSDPIGRGNRWRNQLAVAPVGPGGALEVIDVRTPHLGGTVQFFRLDGDRLIEVASRSGFTSHVIGSRNLDLGIVVDADGDRRLDVVVPTDDRRGIGVLTRTDETVEEVAVLELPGRLSTNIGVSAPGDGGDDAGVTVAVGTDDGVLRLWPAR
ncbi:MAG: hypothetical protein AAGD35_06450 [Actinomycetota bacterium]